MKKIVFILAGMPDGSPTDHDGAYLKDFDFEAGIGRGEVELTANLEEAMKFDDAVSALKFYQTQPKCKPFREDGRPNRPLTATNWEMKWVDV